MREISYRAWYPEKQKMYEVAKIDMWGDPDQATCDLASTDEELFDVYLAEVKVMQFTGLRDKNGKEIYEGDVLRYTKVGGHSSRGIVKYVTEFARWEYWHTQQKQGFSVLSDHDNMEVIGNIYENPELLEV